ncbi:MAG: hypothetical protein ABI765_08040 [Gemmatimonadota bacterium]
MSKPSTSRKSPIKDLPLPAKFEGPAGGSGNSTPAPVSSVMKTKHDTVKTSISNIR